MNASGLTILLARLTDRENSMNRVTGIPPILHLVPPGRVDFRVRSIREVSCGFLAQSDRSIPQRLRRLGLLLPWCHLSHSDKGFDALFFQEGKEQLVLQPAQVL